MWWKLTCILYEFLQRYVKWTYHGEVDMPPVVDDGAPVTDEMIDIINDVIGEQDTNEEGVNEGISDGGGNSAENQFDDLFQEVEAELYPGCTWLSSLNFLVKMMHMKVMNKWTNSSFDELLKFMKFTFPKENKIPASFYESKKKMRKLGLGYQSIHACKYDHCLF